MRILQVEDDSATAQSIELMLKSEGFNVYTTDLGEEGIDLAKNYDYDLITLDLNLPDMWGLDVIKHLRAGKINTPILVLTGTEKMDTKVLCFKAGADDYMIKPFHKDELICRIHAIVRRSRGHTQSMITTGPVTVRLDEKVVEVHGRRLHLTGKEYQMLELLALRKGTTLTKEMFLNHLYGGMDEPELKIVDVFVCKLRKKIKAASGLQLIETVWGRGYVLRDPPGPQESKSPAATEPKPPPPEPLRAEPVAEPAAPAAVSEEVPPEPVEEESHSPLPELVETPVLEIVQDASLEESAEVLEPVAVEEEVSEAPAVVQDTSFVAPAPERKLTGIEHVALALYELDMPTIHARLQEHLQGKMMSQCVSPNLTKLTGWGYVLRDNRSRGRVYRLSEAGLEWLISRSLVKRKAA